MSLVVRKIYAYNNQKIFAVFDQGSSFIWVSVYWRLLRPLARIHLDVAVASFGNNSHKQERAI